MPAKREQTHGHYGSLPGRLRIAERPRRAQRSLVAALALAATHWTVAGLLLVASFWAYLGAAELAGGAIPGMPPLQGTHGIHSPGCTVLTLDRPSGLTSAGPCGPALNLRESLAARLPDPTTH